ncbi:MAG: hypothetical protein NC350_06650, partial [Corallococcus sp.]|nr:hypothetical protein [Corallococcus sp.]
MKDKILIKRNVLRITDVQDGNGAAYAAQLLNRFGVAVDKPKYLTAENLAAVSEFYGKEIPSGFYKHPQHTKYFTCEQLLVEQLISYITVELGGERSLDPEVFTRKPAFLKVLPDYREGDDVKLRFY